MIIADAMTPMLARLLGSVLSFSLQTVFCAVLCAGAIRFLAGYYPRPSTRNAVRHFEMLYRTIRGAVLVRFSANGVTTGSTTKNLLTQERIDPIASRRWKEVLAWIVFHPDELFWMDKSNQTALHHACLFRAPAQVIEMMLYQLPDLATIANVDGEIPLHWAVRLSAPNEVIKWLLVVHPASGCDVIDKNGNTALSLVWERHESTLIRLWWDAGRDAFVAHPGWRSILGFLLCYSFYLAKLHALPAAADGGDEGEALEAHVSSFLPLHTATQCPSCPPSLFPHLLQVYKEQVLVQDEDGRLPLAVACLDPISNRSVGGLTKVNLLLAEHPAAAEVPDYSGRLPVFIALESGLVWEEGIDRLIALAPKSLVLRDPVTRLPAFLLAATGSERRVRRFVEDKSSSADHESYAGDARSLSTIFSLLRADPAQLQCGMKCKHAGL